VSVGVCEAVYLVGIPVNWILDLHIWTLHHHHWPTTAIISTLHLPGIYH